MELSRNYAIDENGVLVYAPPAVGVMPERKYTVWGIGPHGFLHGAGAYFKREEYKEKGIDIIIINEPTYNEIERYYDLLDKFNKFLGDGE